MTKKQFSAHCSAYGATAHYQGSTKTMFVFGSDIALINVTGGGYSSGKIYSPSWLSFYVVPNMTS
jgi:hypothetical protein